MHGATPTAANVHAMPLPRLWGFIGPSGSRSPHLLTHAWPDSLRRVGHVNSAAAARMKRRLPVSWCCWILYTS